jgi:uncharacterized protein (UPF0212 family)
VQQSARKSSLFSFVTLPTVKIVTLHRCLCGYLLKASTFPMSKYFALPALAALAVGVAFTPSVKANTSAQVQNATKNLLKTCAEYAAVTAEPENIGLCGTGVITACAVQNSGKPGAVVSCINHLDSIVKSKEEHAKNAAKNTVNKAGKKIKHFFSPHHHHHHHH